MPYFKQKKVLNVGRKLKVFIDLRLGVGRAVPDEEAKLKRKNRELQSQVESLKDANAQQNKLMTQQKRVTFQLQSEVEALRSVPTGESSDSVPPRPGALPDFLVIGAPRCGTSQFFNALVRHPNVRRPVFKEIHFFDDEENFEKGIDWYRGCFKPDIPGSEESQTFEATPRYLADPQVPGRVREVLPDARFIVLLRDPVDRAYSYFHYMKRLGTPKTFEQAVDEELRWLREGRERGDAEPEWPLLTTGLYVEHLMRWEEAFDRERILVLDSNDFFDRVGETFDRVQDFLKLPRREFDLDLAGNVRGKWYDYEPMDPGVRERLETFFEPYNRRLYDHLGRDFGW